MAKQVGIFVLIYPCDFGMLDVKWGMMAERGRILPGSIGFSGSGDFLNELITCCTKIHRILKSVPAHRETQVLCLRFSITAILLLMLIAVPVAAMDWTTETVDSGGYTGQYTSLALDSSGYPHISYLNGTSGCTQEYAVWNGSAWNIESIDYNPDCGNAGVNALALDHYDYPWIVYRSTSCAMPTGTVHPGLSGISPQIIMANILPLPSTVVDIPRSVFMIVKPQP